jgi:hypothetical protein
MPTAYLNRPVDTNGNEGEKSQPSVITVTAAVDTLYAITSQDIAVSPKKDIYIASRNDEGVFVYDAAMNFKRELSNERLRWPITVCTDDNGTVFVLFYRDDATIKLNIAVYDSAYTLIDSITEVSYAAVGMIAKDSVLYLIDTSYNDGTRNAIQAYSYQGTQRRTVRQDGETRYTCLANGNADTLFVSTGQNIMVLDTVGNLLSTIPASGEICPGSLACDRIRRTLYYVERVETDGHYELAVHMLDNNLTDTVIYSKPESETCYGKDVSIALQKNGNILMGSCRVDIAHFTPSL